MFNKGAKDAHGKRTVSLINGVGKPDNHTQKNETEPLPYTTHNNDLEMH